MTNNNSSASLGWGIVVVMLLAFFLLSVSGGTSSGGGSSIKSADDIDAELKEMEYQEKKVHEGLEIEKTKREAYEDSQEWEEKIDEAIEKGYLR